MTVKEELYRLVDALPDSELIAARSFLETLRSHPGNPFLQALARAPEDDESETLEEAAAVKEAEADIVVGRVVSHEEARRQLLGQS